MGRTYAQFPSAVRGAYLHFSLSLSSLLSFPFLFLVCFCLYFSVRMAVIMARVCLSIRFEIEIGFGIGLFGFGPQSNLLVSVVWARSLDLDSAVNRFASDSDEDSGSLGLRLTPPHSWLILTPTPRGHNLIRTTPDVLIPGCESLYLVVIANSIAKFDPPRHRNYNQNQTRIAVEPNLLILETRLVSSSFPSSPRSSLLPPALQPTSQCCSVQSASQY
jgi:hypothetical protein